MHKLKNFVFTLNNICGSGELSGKMLLGRIVGNNKIDAYFRVD